MIAGSLVLAAFFTAACTTTALHGQSRLEGRYTGRDLRATLPAEVTVAQAAAAAESALLAGGYVISERTIAGDRARLVGEAPPRSGLGPSQRPVVVIDPAPAGAEATITIEPFGDEEASRRILDAMVARLGL